MRIATAVLIVLASMTVATAQQLERPPFYPPPKEVPNRPLFPTQPLDPRVMPFLPVPQTRRPAVPQPVTPQPDALKPVTPPRSGSVCLKTMPVDPSLDRAFVLPTPDTRSLPMRIIDMAPCVTLAPQQPR